MKYIFLFCLSIPFTYQVKAQPNCNVYKLKGDSACYKGCLLAWKAIEYEQGSKESQFLFDSAIFYCSTLDYAYSEKAVPYLKRGEFITWKTLIDKAVELNPTGQLGYRAWCKYQFLRDYTGAINDIEKLDSLINHDIGYSINGDYHLTIVKALCYEGLGQNRKAEEIIEEQLSKEDYSPLLYDYFQLGVLKLKLMDHTGAIRILKKQIELNDYLADTYYYLALAYKMNLDVENYEKNILLAKEFYLTGRHRTDPYTEPMNRIYLTDIETLISSK